MKNKDKKFETARESLDEILKKIGPFMPKRQKAKKETPSTWQIVDSHVLSPFSSSRQR